jgi:hypothetical protein
MTRTTLCAALLLGLLSSASRADVEVAPPPREVGPDGKAPPAPGAKSDDPAETVEKIIKNSKAIADRLAQTDTGTETRKTQGETLALIDSLLNQDNPPPKDNNPDPDQDKNKDQNPDQSNDQKDKKDNDPSGGMGGMPPPMGGMQPGGGEPKDRSQGGRRPRAGSEQAKGNQPKQQPQGAGKNPGGAAKAGQNKDQNPAGATAKKDPNPMGTGKGPNGGGGGTFTPMGPSLPLADDVVKEVWGNLPHREREQLTQYYREQFMPRYSELIKNYFSSLAENSRKSSGEMKK